MCFSVDYKTIKTIMSFSDVIFTCNYSLLIETYLNWWEVKYTQELLDDILTTIGILEYYCPTIRGSLWSWDQFSVHSLIYRKATAHSLRSLFSGPLSTALNWTENLLNR
jgi:hypothetical protein